VLLTMFDTRLRLSNQVSDEVRRYFGDKVFKTIVQRNVRLSEAPSFGRPVILYDATSVGARNYIALAREIIINNQRYLRPQPTSELASGSGSLNGNGTTIRRAANGRASSNSTPANGFVL